MSGTMTFTWHMLPRRTTLTAQELARFKLEKLERTSPVDEVVAALKWNGGVIIRNFFNADEVAETERDALPLLEKQEYRSYKDTTKRVARLPQVMPKLVERLLTDEMYLGVADAILSKEHTAWLGNKKLTSTAKPVVMASTMFEIAPGTAVQDMHRDDSIHYNILPKIEPEDYNVGRDCSLSFFLAGRRTHKDNGATLFVPGSHLQDNEKQPDPDDLVPVELEAGDAFFMLSSAYHCAGANITKDEKRLVYSIFMMAAHLRQEENLYLILSKEVLQTYPIEVQRRLGYDVAPPNLGWIDHRTPLESLLGHENADSRRLPGY